MLARDPCTSVTKYIQHGHYKVGQVSLLTAAKPTETPAAPREKDENGTNRRMEGKRIEWVEYSHLFRSRRTRVSTRARFARSCSFLQRHAVTVVFLEHRGSDQTDKNSTNKGLGLSRRARLFLRTAISVLLRYLLGRKFRPFSVYDNLMIP